MKFWFANVMVRHGTKTTENLLLSVAFISAYTFTVVFIDMEFLYIDFKPHTSIYSLLGIVLGLLLVFRTNTAYERWWEGRRLLGTLVNVSRNLALKIDASLSKGDVANREYFARMIGNYAYAMKEHLREGVIYEEMEPVSDTFKEELNQYDHKPNRIAGMIMERLNRLYLEGKFTDAQLINMDKQAEAFTDVVGGCERIRKTPIPISYRMHLKRFITLYVLVLPFGYMSEMDYWTIPTVSLIFYALAGLESIGEEIEDPFGRDANDLPTDEISANIRKHVKEILVKG